MNKTLILLIFGAFLLATPKAEAAPKRSLETIAWAIKQVNGSLSSATLANYAKALKKTAEKNDFDPLTGVALIWHESRWRASVIGDDGEAIGLAQIHYRNLCKKDGSNCESVRQSLLVGANNIRVMGAIISTCRKYCRRVTGKPALFARWLHAYGYRQKENLKCNMQKRNGRWKDKPVPTELRRIIRYRRNLIKKLYAKRKRSRRRKRR